VKAAEAMPCAAFTATMNKKSEAIANARMALAGVEWETFSTWVPPVQPMRCHCVEKRFSAIPC
jgi:hypothetical protein